MGPLIAFLIVFIVSILFAVYKRIDTFEIRPPLYSPILITRDTKISELDRADSQKITLLESLKAKYDSLSQVASVTPTEAEALGLPTTTDSSGNQILTQTVNLPFLQDFISLEIETYKMRQRSMAEGNGDQTIAESMRAANADSPQEEIDARLTQTLVHFNEKEAKFNGMLTALAEIEGRSKAAVTTTTQPLTTTTTPTTTPTTTTTTTPSGTTVPTTTTTTPTPSGTTASTGTTTPATTASTGTTTPATTATTTTGTTGRTTTSNTTTATSPSTMDLKDLLLAFGSIQGKDLRSTKSDEEDLEQAPIMSSQYSKEMEDRLAKRVASQVKDSLLTQRTSNNIMDDMSCPYASYSHGVQQGKEYQQVKPIQSSPDMSQYIRKDSIPCWNCSLP